MWHASTVSFISSSAGASRFAVLSRLFYAVDFSAQNIQENGSFWSVALFSSRSLSKNLPRLSLYLHVPPFFFFQRLKRRTDRGGGVARARAKSAARRSQHRFRFPFLYRGSRRIIVATVWAYRRWRGQPQRPCRGQRPPSEEGER